MQAATLGKPASMPVFAAVLRLNPILQIAVDDAGITQLPLNAARRFDLLGRFATIRPS
jgi:hypothetical protein